MPCRAVAAPTALRLSAIVSASRKSTMRGNVPSAFARMPSAVTITPASQTSSNSAYDSASSIRPGRSSRFPKSRRRSVPGTRVDRKPEQISRPCCLTRPANPCAEPSARIAPRWSPGGKVTSIPSRPAARRTARRAAGTPPSCPLHRRRSHLAFEAASASLIAQRLQLMDTDRMIQGRSRRLMSLVSSFARSALPLPCSRITRSVD